MSRDSVTDLAALTTPELERRLERLFAAEPALRPRAEEHDYQLTYPPAVAVEKARYARAPSDAELRELGLGALEGVAFYFHFGFCAYRCRYCFHYELKTRRDDALMERYVDALALDLDRAKALVGEKRNLLYFLGGGTPTALPTALLERFLDRLVSTLGPPPTALSTVEAKPVTATDDKLRALVAAGFRRVNLGVQTLDPELYAFHHHGEDLRVATDAIERARKAGFDYVNIDVMTGLERQSAASWDTTLRGLESLCRSGAVDSVFIYPYHDDPRSKTYGHAGLVPSFAETAQTDARARALFERLGFSELGVRFYRSRRHVARELMELARVRRSPTYGEVLYHGLGNSSFSVGDRATYLNHRDAVTYCEEVEAGRSAISHFATLTDAQRAARDVTFDLLYSPITRVRSREAKYGAAAMRPHRERFKRWSELGLGAESRLFGTFKLTPLGKLVHQQMLAAHYLPADRAEQSLAMRARAELGRRYRGY